jgi:diguanylate cyclase
VTGDAFDEFDFEYATAIAEKTVRLMSQHRVPPTPNNFHIWFKYSLGTSPDLKRAIDILIANKRKFDTPANRDLFAMYVGADTGDDTDVSNVSQQLHSVVATAKQYLNVAIADNRSQMMAIGDIAERSEVGVDPTLLVENLLNELAKAVNRAAKLEACFAESTRELDAIRNSDLPNRRALDEFSARPRSR